MNEYNNLATLVQLQTALTNHSSLEILFRVGLELLGLQRSSNYFLPMSAPSSSLPVCGFQRHFLITIIYTKLHLT